MYFLLSVPIVLAVLKRYRFKGYFLSPVITLSCLLIALLSAREGKELICLAYGFSVIGDFFLAHQKISPFSYLFGVGGFFTAHAFFLSYAFLTARFSYWSVICAVILIVPYGRFLINGLYPNIRELSMRIAVTMYMLISIAVFSAAVSMDAAVFEKLLFTAGIAMILFSDTLIALSDFMGRRKLGSIILPAYYACHILIAASMIL